MGLLLKLLWVYMPVLFLVTIVQVHVSKDSTCIEKDIQEPHHREHWLYMEMVTRPNPQDSKGSGQSHLMVKLSF